MNTVGKPGKLGARVRCVVSVSMLTEGWDANTVTHILGVRAFSTQLLCEQVVGRGLRRMSYVPNDDGMFEPEYAEVYGVPFSFIPSAGIDPNPKPPRMVTRVRALEDRIDSEITFPRLTGYRYEIADGRLEATFDEDSLLALSTQDVPTKTELRPIVGEITIDDLADLKRRRDQEVVFFLAKLVLEKYFTDGDGGVKPWLFPQLLRISKGWIDECLTLKDNTFPQLLLLHEHGHDASDRIYKAITASHAAVPLLRPILRDYEPTGSTLWVDFDTTRTTYTTRADKCHVSHVVADSGWEVKMAETLEDMGEVIAYVKNQGLGFTIPYTLNGAERSYVPDFIVRIADGGDEPLNLIIEVSGQAKKDKKAKVTTARTLWVPAVNNHAGFGRWDFIEITDPWDAASTARAQLAQATDELALAGAAGEVQ